MMETILNFYNVYLYSPNLSKLKYFILNKEFLKMGRKHNSCLFYKGKNTPRKCSFAKKFIVLLYLLSFAKK